MTIGTALKTWRNGLDITQAEAALRANVSQATWCDWEGDKKLPSSDKAFDLEDLTGGAVTARDCAEALRASRASRGEGH